MIDEQFPVDVQPDLIIAIRDQHSVGFVHYLFKGAPKIECFMSRALSVGFCFFALGCGGALVPDLPGVPTYDFFPRALPGDRCGFGIEAMLPDEVAPAVACSNIS